MPLGLFTNKFSPKKGAPRKTHSLTNLNLDRPHSDAEFGIDYGPIKLKLGSNEIVFDGGEWISEAASAGGGGGKELHRVKQQNKQLKEENNLLKIKIDLLLDMLSQRTAEMHLQRK